MNYILNQRQQRQSRLKRKRRPKLANPKRGIPGPRGERSKKGWVSDTLAENINNSFFRLVAQRSPEAHFIFISVSETCYGSYSSNQNFKSLQNRPQCVVTFVTLASHRASGPVRLRVPWGLRNLINSVRACGGWHIHHTKIRRHALEVGSVTSWVFKGLFTGARCKKDPALTQIQIQL